MKDAIFHFNIFKINFKDELKPDIISKYKYLYFLKPSLYDN